ncbi:hypothetical protein [Peptostreptococcus equinus]|uniref:Uncharacterized protein n=1 Tax=Peptostreptococcus equinus TaxID=3003601 RepID=A0ABY7JRI1_9FIRM|nr:hypothetical protein [Peptostreptococcus sp. CBA3647]WAW14552.1 hypothetical protein O0R46_08095 [Peptostreptococcus sp. CBA3647]
MGIIISYIFISVSAVILTILGILALNMRLPIEFIAFFSKSNYSIMEVKPFSKEHGIVWILSSMPLWISLFLIENYLNVAFITLLLTINIGIPLNILAYSKIRKKYSRESNIFGRKIYN